MLEQLNSINHKGDRILTLTESTWSEYELLIAQELPVLISYLENCTTIVAPGRNHERIAKTIGILIQAYCRLIKLPYFALGSKDIKKQFVTGKQPDESYCFYEEKETPDLAVEVNFSSGSFKDLEKYQLLDVSEVWMWENDRLSIFLLHPSSNYFRSESSQHLLNLEVKDIEPFVRRSLQEDNLTLETEFLKLWKN